MYEGRGCRGTDDRYFLDYPSSVFFSLLLLYLFCVCVFLRIFRFALLHLLCARVMMYRLGRVLVCSFFH